MNTIDMINDVIESEIKSIINVKESVDNSYVQAVEKIVNCKGKVIFLGVGKSGHIGKKLAATFASTGTPSFFIHATEAVHGDLGMISSEDVVVALSNSGETKEVLSTLQSIKKIEAGLISITGNKDSKLAQSSDITIEVSIKSEADQFNLAPTNSSTVTLVVGDAIAVTVSQIKGFKREDFGLYHPGGSLGKQLLEDGVINTRKDDAL